MKTKNKVSQFIFLVALAVSFLLPGFATADVNTTLYIQGPGGSVLVDTSLVVPESCTVVDSTGAATDFSGHKAICALKVAKDTGVIADFAVTDAGFAFSLDSVNGIVNAPDWSELWQLWLNGITAEIGIQGLVLSEGDAFQLTYGPWKTEIIQAATPDERVGGPIVVDVYPRTVDVESAVSFLVANQQQDGSFGYALFTDWAAVALGAYDGKSASAFYSVNALKEWLIKNPIPEGALLTDYERRAMTLMSLGIDPYQGTNKNYIEAILQGFDGQQFGSPNVVNDDIFAVLVLHQAGYEANVTPLLETFPFILSWQRESGSFGSGDLTAAAIQVLSLFPESVQRDEALRNAREYLASQQESTGGFGNVYSTSWALQAIAALQEDGDAWAMEVDRRTPEHFLAFHQALDGGLLKEESKENRIWATAYAVPAVLQKSWGDILHSFENPAPVVASPVVEVAEIEEELTQEEIDALSAQFELVGEQVDLFGQELLLSLETTQKLQEIGQQVARITLEVEGLKAQVAILHQAYLAQREEQQDDQALAIQQESKKELSQLHVLGDGTITLQQEDAKDNENGENLAAAAAGTVDTNFFSTTFGQLLVAGATGVALFLLLGGWGFLARFFRRRVAI
tara:strand:- start:6258 stop:8138 length:1881 start_codon:yes stop_codon:yes gene_type:complete